MDEINLDIWNKSLYVCGLMEWVMFFLLEIVGKYDDVKIVYKVLVRVVIDYIKIFGINVVVLLLMYKDVIIGENVLLYRKVESEWDKIFIENIVIV